MNQLKQYILFKGLTLILVVTLLVPSVVKFMHIFQQHHHEVCLGESEVHFHTLDIECEFYKFKINIPFTIPENNFVIVDFHEINTIIIGHYAFLSDYQSLHFSLRGPPSINLI